jgi:MFS family permease
MGKLVRDLQYHKFRAYGFLKNLRFFDPFLLLFLREAGLSFLAIGTLISIREIATNVLEIPTGVLADAFGRRKAMLFGFGAYLASFVLFFLGSRYWIFVLAMLAFAIGETFRSGTHKAMILEHLRLSGHEEDKVRYYGKTRAASQFGSALASLIAAGLVFWTGSFRVVFLGSMLPYVLNFFLLASYPRSLDGETIASLGSGWRLINQHFREAFRGLVSMARSPDLLRGLGSGAAFDALFKSTKDYLQPVIQTQALALPIFVAWHPDQRTAVLIGIVYFLIYLLTSLACAGAGAIHARLRSETRGINVSFLLAPTVLLLSGIATWRGSQVAAIVGFVVLFVLQNLRRPMVVGYLADHMPHRLMASGLSVEVQLRTLLMAGMAPALGWLADTVGVGIGISVIAAAVLSLSGFVRVRPEGTPP